MFESGVARSRTGWNIDDTSQRCFIHYRRASRLINANCSIVLLPCALPSRLMLKKYSARRGAEVDWGPFCASDCAFPHRSRSASANLSVELCRNRAGAAARIVGGVASDRMVIVEINESLLENLVEQHRQRTCSELNLVLARKARDTLTAEEGEQYN